MSLGQYICSPVLFLVYSVNMKEDVALVDSIFSFAVNLLLILINSYCLHNTVVVVSKLVVSNVTSIYRVLLNLTSRQNPIENGFNFAFKNMASSTLFLQHFFVKK